MASVRALNRSADPFNHPPPFDNNDMDAETAALIARLALEDLEEVVSGRKGKSRVGAPLSDEEYAYQLQSQNFQEMLAFAEDVKYAQSLNVALATDTAYLEAAMAAEAAAAEDRRAAEMLSRGEPLPPPTALQMRLEQPEFVMHPDPPAAPVVANVKGKLKEPAFYEQEWRSDGDSESDLDHLDYDENVAAFARYSSHRRDALSASGPGTSGQHNKSVHCVICADSVKSSQALHAPCKHYYCRDCVSSLVETFTRDESLFPLRCCKEPIPITQVTRFIASALRALFLQKHAEFSVLAQDRVYCVNPPCSTFLGSADGITGSSITCPSCRTTTCHRCKQAGHADEDCVANAATVELRAIARQAGWQTCPGCHALVELSIGCFHMTCRCRTEFCYLCAMRWKTCVCAQWEENRLLQEAQHRVENELGVRAVAAMAPEVRNRQVHDRAEVLRFDHHCDRHVWKHRQGGGTCEECSHYLPEFLKICRHCSILACVRCTRNRL